MAIQLDLCSIFAVLKETSVVRQIEADVDIETSLNSCKKWVLSELRDVGLSCFEPEIFIVESLPPPFERAPYSAFCADMGDLEQYGINPGVYFVKRLLRPVYSRYLLLHEIIHFVLGQSHPEEFGRGLEEGLCEVLGSVILSQKYFGTDLTRNLFIYNRLSSETEQFWELYLDYTRFATALYQRYGLSGIIELIKQGRPAIKKLECQILSKGYITFPLKVGAKDDLVESLLLQLVHLYGRHLYVSPLAFLIHRSVKAGLSIQEIAKSHSLDVDKCREAVRELQERICVSVLRPDGMAVTFSDAPMLYEANAIRYALQ
jgi:hypothetical protein